MLEMSLGVLVKKIRIISSDSYIKIQNSIDLPHPCDDRKKITSTNISSLPKCLGILDRPLAFEWQRMLLGLNNTYNSIINDFQVDMRMGKVSIIPIKVFNPSMVKMSPNGLDMPTISGSLSYFFSKA